MSDGNSIAGGITDAIKDLGKEVVKQVVGTGTSSIKTATSQVTGGNSQEQEAEKKAEQLKTFQRVKEVEAEMRQIAAQSAQKTGPEIPKSEKQSLSEPTNNQTQTVDEASRQAVGRAEQGRNFKG